MTLFQRTRTNRLSLDDIDVDPGRDLNVDQDRDLVIDGINEDRERNWFYYTEQLLETFTTRKILNQLKGRLENVKPDKASTKTID